MPMMRLRLTVTKRPGFVVLAWFMAAMAIGWFSPDLTRIAAVGQANLLGRDAESFAASAALRGVARSVL